MRKIFFYTDDITFTGGVERVIINLANEFINKYEVTIISNSMKKDVQYTYDKKIKFFNLDLKNNSKFLRKMEIILKLNKFLKNEDGVILGMGTWNAVPLVFIKNKKLIKVASEHLAYNKIPLQTRILRKIFYKYLDGINILTEFDKKKYEKLNKNIFVIPNFINYTEEKKENKLTNKKVIAIGRLEYQKGFDILLKIWDAIEKEIDDWELKIYGDGSQKEELIKEKNKLNLKNIEFCGEVKDIYSKLNESSIFVLSSRYEGFGLVLLEASACGVPCVSFDCETGPRDIINNGKNGYLIEEGDLEEFKNKIILLMKNYDLRIKIASESKKVINKYAKENVLRIWDKMFLELEKINK